ncbi:unnamed protein product [Choristocarpus tenellus]
MMKSILALAITAAASHAFVLQSPPSLVATSRSAERINTMHDLESPKVATMDAVDAGEKKVYCRCWKSDTFPLCDGNHVKHNKETGDNVGPLIVSGPKP